jgi:hypothetical protein
MEDTVTVRGHRRDHNTIGKRNYRGWNEEWYVLASESKIELKLVLLTS